jgi:O-antigen/teichoic acid export membrane protein
LSNIKIFAKDTLIYGIGNSIRKVIGIILLPFYTRALSPDEYGILETLATFIAFISAITNMGLTAATSRYFFKAESQYERGKVLFTSIIMQFTINGLAFLIILMLAKQISLALFETTNYWIVIAITSILVVSVPISEQQMMIFRYYRQVWKFITVAAARAILQPVLGIIFVVVLQMSVLGANLATVISSVALLLFAFIYYSNRHYTYKISTAWAKKMFHYGYPLIGATLAMWVFSVSDRFFLLRYSNLHDIGLYSIGNTFAQPLLLINSAINMSAVVLLMSLYQSETDTEKPKTKKFLDDMWLLYLNISIPISLFISVFSVEIFGVLTTQEYLAGALVTPFLLFGLIFTQSFTMAGVGMDLKEKTKPYFWIMLLTAVLNVSLNFVFIPLFSYVGAGITAFISNFAYFILAYLWSQRYFYIKRRLDKIFLYVFSCFILSLIIPFAELALKIDVNFLIKTALFIAGLSVPFVIGLVNKSHISAILISTGINRHIPKQVARFFPGRHRNDDTGQP